MYVADTKGAQPLLGYSDLFSDKAPELTEEIPKLNMNKAISIICELIQIRDKKTPSIDIGVGEISFPSEWFIKSILCGDENKPFEDMIRPVYEKKKHVLSLQMLLILLKGVIRYGNYETLSDNDYTIQKDDYVNIIKLQLAIADQVDKRYSGAFDSDYFLYGTYHLNHKRNIICHLIRNYYMFEILDRDINIFEEDVRKEYRDYNTVFFDNYGIYPAEYFFLLFRELETYYGGEYGLTYRSNWKKVNDEYAYLKDPSIANKVISILAKPVSEYMEWAKETLDREWDFSNFFAFPFLTNDCGEYVSVSDVTIINAFFEKLFWLIHECYPIEDDHCMTFYGRLFEKYIQTLTQEAAGCGFSYIPEFSYGPRKNKVKSSDAYLLKGDCLLAVEVKGFSVLLDCMTKNEKVEDNNNKLFVGPVLQADKFLNRSLTGVPFFSCVENVYVVSVTMDNINAIPDRINEMHNTIETEKKCDKVKYYFNFSIDEYEMLMYLVESGMDIFAILKDYFDTVRLAPFGNYIIDRYPIKKTSFMTKVFEQATERMKALHFGDK